MVINPSSAFTIGNIFWLLLIIAIGLLALLAKR